MDINFRDVAVSRAFEEMHVANQSGHQGRALRLADWIELTAHLLFALSSAQSTLSEYGEPDFMERRTEALRRLEHVMCLADRMKAGAAPKPREFDDMTEVELRAMFQRVATLLRAELPPLTGFMLIASKFGEGGVAQYAGNCEREDAVRWMRETIARWGIGDFVDRGEEHWHPGKEKKGG